MSERKSIYAALLAIQQGINAPKDKKGYGYDYRTTDGILGGAKPLMQEQGVICVLSDESKQVGNRYYIKATATLIDIATGESISATGEAVEPDKLASMAPPQITGTASTYARKRALEGLFLLDNEKDVDSREVQDAIKNSRQTAQKAPQQSSNASMDMRAKALASLTAKHDMHNYDWAKIKAIAIAKYNKDTKSLTVNELCELTNNIEQWYAESVGA